MGRAGPLGLGMIVGVPVFADHLPPLWAIAAAALVSLAAALHWRTTPLTALALGVCLGGLALHGVPPGPRLRGPVALVGVVVSAPSGATADVAVTRACPIGGVWTPTSGRVRVRFPAPQLAVPGVRVAVVGVGAQLVHHAPPGAPDPVRAARMARIDTAVDAWDARQIGGDPGPPAREVPGLLRAISLGDRTGVDAEMLQLMRDTGTAHLLAVSGSNVALAAVALIAVARLALGAVALRWPQGLGGPWLPVAATLGAVGFSWFVGLPTSAQRAMAAAVVVAGAGALKRRVDPLDVIGAAAIAMILVDPSTVATASFHLSFGAVLGLFTWGRRMDAAIPESMHVALAAPLRLLAASAAATIGTLPASAWWFQSLAPLGVLANLFAVPWSTFVLTPCAFAALLGPDVVAGPATSIGVWATEVQRMVLRPLAVEPWHPAVGPGGALALCAIYLLASRPLWAALWTAALLGAPRAAPDGLRVTFLDVGQGMSALAEWPSGERWLIDTGAPRADVVAGLRRLGVRRVDTLLLTHGDLDHAGGAAAVLQQLEVGALVLLSADPADPLLALAEAAGVAHVAPPRDRLHPPTDVAVDGNDGGVVLALGDAPPGPPGPCPGFGSASAPDSASADADDSETPATATSPGAPPNHLGSALASLAPRHVGSPADRIPAAAGSAPEANGAFATGSEGVVPPHRPSRTLADAAPPPHAAPPDRAGASGSCPGPATTVCRVLITGDVSTEVEQTLHLPRCAVLQVGHHGSRTSTGDALLNAVAPQLAVIPVGRDNTYGHPAAAPLQRLIDRAIDVLRTDLHGTVELTWHGEAITVRTHRYGEGWSNPAPLPDR